MEKELVRDIIKWVFTFAMVGVTVGWGDHNRSVRYQLYLVE